MSLSGFSCCDDSTQQHFDAFYNAALELLNRFYPELSITVTSRDQPAIKAKLRRGNRAGRMPEHWIGRDC